MQELRGALRTRHRLLRTLRLDKTSSGLLAILTEDRVGIRSLREDFKHVSEVQKEPDDTIASPQYKSIVSRTEVL